MKRSLAVRRVLVGGFSAGIVAVSAAAAERRVTPESYYTNDYYLPGAGYYHAPFHGFFSQPYNFYDATRRQYFYGGMWGPAPHRSIVNISAPTPDAAQRAESLRTDLGSTNVYRGGFGSSSNYHFTHS